MVGCDNGEIMHMVLEAFPSAPCIINSFLGLRFMKSRRYARQTDGQTACQGLAVARRQRKQKEGKAGEDPRVNKHWRGVVSLEFRCGALTEIERTSLRKLIERMG